MIENSLRCHCYGWLSLIPMLGLPFVVLAIQQYHRTWAEAGENWNPAKRHLTAGLALAWIGALMTFGAVALFVLILIHEYGY
jgi:hypothetical protein